jgi:hypothetical protein
MGKKLTVNTLKSQDSKQYTKRELTINGYKVEIDEKFRPTTIQRLLVEFFEKYQYIQENNIQINIVEYFPILLIKYFTSIDIPDDLETQLKIYELLIDNDYFEPIFNAFPKEEVTKIYEIAKNIRENSEELSKQIKDNPELLDTFNFLVNNNVIGGDKNA